MSLSPVTDSASGLESAGITVSVALADTGAGADLVAVVKEAIKTIADSGTAAESLQVAVSVPVADGGTGADLAAQIEVALAIAESAGGTDAVVAFDTVSRIVTVRFSLKTRQAQMTFLANETNYTQH